MVKTINKTTNPLSQQVDDIIITRRMSSSSDENEIIGTQHKKKILNIKSEIIRAASNSNAKKILKSNCTASTSSSKKKPNSLSTKKTISKKLNSGTSTGKPSSNINLSPTSTSIKRKQQNVDDGPSTSQGKIKHHTSDKKFKVDPEIEEESDEYYEEPEDKEVEEDDDMAEAEREEDVEEVEAIVDDLMDANNNPDLECEQLLGRNFTGDSMTNIGSGIFCKSIIFEMALGSSHKATHVARKLLEGVFTKEALLTSTISGLPARAQGRERQNIKVKMLNVRARNAIIQFSKVLAAKKGWIPSSNEQIERAMSQRIGEIKRSAN